MEVRRKVDPTNAIISPQRQPQQLWSLDIGAGASAEGPRRQNGLCPGVGKRILSEPALGAAVSGGFLQPTEQRIATPQGGRGPGNRLSILPVARYMARPIHSCTAVSKIRNPLPGSKIGR